MRSSFGFDPTPNPLLFFARKAKNKSSGKTKPHQWHSPTNSDSTPTPIKNVDTEIAKSGSHANSNKKFNSKEVKFLGIEDLLKIKLDSTV